MAQMKNFLLAVYPGNPFGPGIRWKSMLVQFLTVDHLTLSLAVKILEDGFQAVSGAFVKGPGAGVLNPL